jgi:ankyrin repeat protein
MDNIKLTQQALDEHLLWACDEGSSRYAALAVAAGANVNVLNDNDQTPLHVVAGTYNKPPAELRRIAELLIQNGADPNARSNLGNTPKDLAERQGNEDLSRLLETAVNQQGHAGRVTGERKDKGPPQVGG